PRAGQRQDARAGHGPNPSPPTGAGASTSPSVTRPHVDELSARPRCAGPTPGSPPGSARGATTSVRRAQAAERLPAFFAAGFLAAFFGVVVLLVAFRVPLRLAAVLVADRLLDFAAVLPDDPAVLLARPLLPFAVADRFVLVARPFRAGAEPEPKISGCSSPTGT